MKLSQPNKVSASQGWQWVNQGARYFLAFKNQWLLTLMLLFLITMSLFSLSPFFQIILVVVFPFVTAGLALACHDIEQGKAMTITYLLKAKDNPNRTNIFRYGLLVIVMIILAQLLSSVFLSLLGVSNDEVIQAMTLIKTGEEVTFAVIGSSPVLLKFILTNMLFLLPMMAVNQIAPVILALTSLTGIEALKLSFIAVYKNLSAFITYLIVFIALVVIIIIVLKVFVYLLLMLFGENSKIAFLLYISSLMLSIISLVALSYCSSYVIFKDLFSGES